MEKNNKFALIAIISIVAIVALVVLIINAGKPDLEATGGAFYSANKCERWIKLRDNYDNLYNTYCVCYSNNDCLSNQYCKFENGCSGAGKCTEKPQTYIEIYAPVCGCDGKTYGNKGEAAHFGINIKHEGECSCNSNSDCSTKEYCKKESCDAAGKCTAKGQLCPEILAPVCGCDGKTYENKCFAALSGINIKHDGKCKEQVCGNGLCEEGEDRIVCPANSLDDSGCFMTCPQDCSTCTDTDGGRNFYVKGTATGKDPYSDNIRTETDKCSSNNEIIEFECKPNSNEITWNGYPCPTGTTCIDGACQQFVVMG